MAKLDQLGPIDTQKDKSGELPKHAHGVVDAAGTRILEGMESMEEAADALVTFGQTQDEIMSALLAIDDLIQFDGTTLQSTAHDYLVRLAQADPKDRPALKQRAVDGINNFITVVNAAEPIHQKRITELVKRLETLSRSLQK